MLTSVIEVLIDVIVEWLFTILIESSLSFILVDLVHLDGLIIIICSLERPLNYERLLLL